LAAAHLLIFFSESSRIELPSAYIS